MPDTVPNTTPNTTPNTNEPNTNEPNTNEPNTNEPNTNEPNTTTGHLPDRQPDTSPTLPEYGRRSLAEIIPSLRAALDGRANPLGIEPASRVCLLLVDGLGAEQLQRFAAEAPFLASLPRPPGSVLTAGFPSSTPVSLSSLGTGAPPGAHGMVGVSFRADHGELLDALRWTSPGENGPVDQREAQPPERVQPLETALHRATQSGVSVRVVSSRMFAGSGLTRAALRGGEYRGVHALGDLAAELIDALAEPAPVLCYGYHADLDALGHIYGPGSLPWRLQLTVVDRVAALIAEALPPDGLLVVTSDHGMVTVAETERFDADHDPALRDGVRLLGGDPRARHVYAQPGAADDVLAAWSERLGSLAWVVPGEQALAEGWFGPVESEVIRRRIGDVVVAMRGRAAVVRSSAEPVLATLVGQHGSLTASEQHIPLLLARR